jgi:hypothetical protein
MTAGDQRRAGRAASRNVLIWISGAQPKDVEYRPTDRRTFTIMGITILTTAAVAAVSCTFALHVALNMGLWSAIPIGMAWGTIVVSIDRYIVPSVPGERGTRRVARAAVGLVATASWLLPASDRARYAEECLRELWDITKSGAGCLLQLKYALRLLLRALPMRLALRSPRRRSAAP